MSDLMAEVLKKTEELEKEFDLYMDACHARKMEHDKKRIEHALYLESQKITCKLCGIRTHEVYEIPGYGSVCPRCHTHEREAQRCIECGKMIEESFLEKRGLGLIFCEQCTTKINKKNEERRKNFRKGGG
jgi:glutamate formiminotransferase